MPEIGENLSHYSIVVKIGKGGKALLKLSPVPPPVFQVLYL